MFLLKKNISIILFIAVLMAAMSFINASEKSKLSIQFHHMVGSKLLKLDSVFYENELNQSFTISKFKYYIGNIQLKKKNGTSFNYNTYFLVNEEEELSKQIELNNIPDGEYNSIRFILGVDSSHNCSGIQTGALDPINAMFWAWNTGYIFLKLDGSSPASNSPKNIFEFHIGGYKQPNNCIREINLNFSNPLIISSTNKSTIHIKTDVIEIFKTPISIDLSKISSVTNHQYSTTIANNYADMFSLITDEK